MITADELRKMLHYNPDTGEWAWLVRKGRGAPGRRAGKTYHNGYVRIMMAGKTYAAHRLAFLYMTGEWPETPLDLINMDKDDNRWCNLRQASPSCNKANTTHLRNSKTRVKGVSPKGSRYVATITCKSILYHIGSFKTIEEASKAYAARAKELFGEFARA